MPLTGEKEFVCAKRRIVKQLFLSTRYWTTWIVIEQMEVKKVLSHVFFKNRSIEKKDIVWKNLVWKCVKDQSTDDAFNSSSSCFALVAIWVSG